MENDKSKFKNEFKRRLYNFTLKTIAKLEVALGESIIIPIDGSEYKNIHSQASKSIENIYSKVFDNIKVDYNKEPIRDLSIDMYLMSKEIENQKLRYKSVIKK